MVTVLLLIILPVCARAIVWSWYTNRRMQFPNIRIIVSDRAVAREGSWGSRSHQSTLSNVVNFAVLQANDDSSFDPKKRLPDS